MSWPLRILAMGCVALLATAPALAQPEAPPEEPVDPGAPTAVEIQISMISPSEAQFVMVQVWDAAKAPEFRRSLDAFFGDGDGNLSVIEIEHIAATTEDNMTSQTLPWISIDGSDAAVASADVTLDGFETGAAATPRMTHVVTAVLSPGAGPNHTLAIDSYWDAQLRVDAPDGFVLSTTGARAAAGETVSEVLLEGERVSFELSPAERVEETTPPVVDEPPIGEDAPSGPLIAIPAPALPTLLATLAVSAAIALRRMRRA